MQALNPEYDGRTAAIIQENFDEEIYQDRDHTRVYRRARKVQGSLGCICAIQVFKAWATEGAEGQRQRVVALEGGPQPGGVVHRTNPRGWLLGEVQAIPQTYS